MTASATGPTTPAHAPSRLPPLGRWAAVIGVGVRPAVGWLEGSGLELDNGIVVDERCRTNLPDVFAAGDAANWWHPRLQARLRLLRQVGTLRAPHSQRRAGSQPSRQLPERAL